MQHFLTLGALWFAWVIAGILYDPIMAPDAKNGAPHGPGRFLVLWAFCQTLRGWLFVARLGKPRDTGKSLGELAAAVFVMGSRKYLRQAIRLVEGRR